MSKHDFTAAEFADRRARLRAALHDRDLDWLVVIHPVAIRWLTGSDAKSYQEFQCLFFSAEEAPLTVLTRAGEVAEFQDDALVDEVVGWGGGIAEDPIPHFTAWRKAGPGCRSASTPAYYLHPYHLLALREALGASLWPSPPPWSTT